MNVLNHQVWKQLPDADCKHSSQTVLSQSRCWPFFILQMATLKHFFFSFYYCSNFLLSRTSFISPCEEYTTLNNSKHHRFCKIHQKSSPCTLPAVHIVLVLTTKPDCLQIPGHSSSEAQQVGKVWELDIVSAISNRACKQILPHQWPSWRQASSGNWQLSCKIWGQR